VTALLASITVLAWGLWIPVAQAAPGVPQRSRTFYATVGNVVFAALALAAGGGQLHLGGRTFWLPLAGGLVWTAGSYCAFRASALIGLARASGSWTPLNIIVAFAWGALLFSELSRFRAGQYALLSVALMLVLAGVFLIIRSRDAAEAFEEGPDRAPATGQLAEDAADLARPGGYRRGIAFAAAAGLLWGSYFIPAQWAQEPSQVSNFPLALGMLLGGALLVASSPGAVRLPLRITGIQLTAGLLFGVGNLALLGLVARVGTGVGFTIAQLSLLVNASVGIFWFRVPKPGSRAARVAIVGILLAGLGGVAIGTLR